MTKTRKQILNEMKAQLEHDVVKLTVVADYKRFQFESDPKFKGNTEAKKELDASLFTIERTEHMLSWVKAQIKKCK